MAHWRQNHQSDVNHLKSSDLFDAVTSERTGRDAYVSPTVRIVKMSVDVIKSKEKPRGEKRNFAHFEGKAKPLGLNVTNAETLESISGSGDPARWVGLTITLFVDPQARYPSGKKGPAIRIKPMRARGPVDTSPLPEVPEGERARLEGEHAERIAEGEREPGDDA